MADAVLEAREARWNRRLAISRALGPQGALLTLTLRMPAALRLSGDYDGCAETAFRDLSEDARRAGFEIADSDFRGSGDGPEGYLSIRADASAAKAFAVGFERDHPWGPLFDVDVMGPGGGVLGRGDLGLEPRTCIACGGPALACVVEGRHGTEELRALIDARLANPPRRGP